MVVLPPCKYPLLYFKHFMNSALKGVGTYSCAVGSFLNLYRWILYRWILYQKVKYLPKPSVFISHINQCISIVESSKKSTL